MYYGEKLNSISHLVGAVFALIALGALLALGIQTREAMTIIGYSTFGLTLVLLYTMSTLYHGIWHFFVLVGSVCHFTSVIGYVR